jgi:plastocyanin
MYRSTNRSRPVAILGILAVAVLVLAACGGSGTSATPTDAGDGGTAASEPASEPAAGGETVSLAGGQFSPAELTIPTGTTVTFTNTSGHTVTEGSNGTAVDDPIVDEQGGEDIPVTFDEPGTYDITCKIHPSMNMTVTVEG